MKRPTVQTIDTVITRSGVLRHTQEQIVHYLALGASAVSVAFLITQLYLLAIGAGRLNYFIGVLFISMLVWLAALRRLLPYLPRALLLSTAIYAIGIFGSYNFGYGGSARMLLAIAPFILLMTLGKGAGVAGILLSTLIVANTGLRQINGAIVAPDIEVVFLTPGVTTVNFVAAFLIACIAGIVAIRQLLQDAEGALRHERNLEQELIHEGRVLEQRVASRSQALETSLDISRHISNILDLDDLAMAVVRQIKATMGYYHVQIYLLHETEPFLYLSSDSLANNRSTAGKNIPLGEGLIGRAAVENRTLLIPDVQDEPSWRPIEYLPYTKAELAVPLTLNTQILGVLDVQSDQVFGLNQDDVYLVETIASQVAVALQNARIYQQVRHQGEREILLSKISQALREAEDVDEVLQIAATELGRALNIPRVRIGLTQAEARTGREQPLITEAN